MHRVAACPGGMTAQHTQEVRAPMYRKSLLVTVCLVALVACAQRASQPEEPARSLPASSSPPAAVSPPAVPSPPEPSERTTSMGRSAGTYREGSRPNGLPVTPSVGVTDPAPIDAPLPVPAPSIPLEQTATERP